LYRLYLITNSVNQKVYIGQTVRSLKARWRSHLSASKEARVKDVYFYRAINKYGPAAFTMEELAQTESKVEIDRLEKFWIGFCLSFQKDKGYNTTFGGEGGRQTPEVRRKIGEASKRLWQDPDFRKRSCQTRKGLLVGARNPMFGKSSFKGKKHTDLTKLKLSLIKKEQFSDPSFKLKMTLASTGKHHTAAGRANISRGLQGNQYRKGIPHSEEVKERIRNSMKAAWVLRKNKKFNSAQELSETGLGKDKNLAESMDAPITLAGV
jgi:group I intron endonuclease